MDRDKPPDAELQQEWLRQNNLMYGALMGVGVVMVQPFLTASTLDTSAKVSVIAFAVAIPLLSALVLVNQQENFRRRATSSVTVAAAKAIAMGAAITGVVAGFWHISWIAGVTILASGLVATGVHSAGYVRLEHDSDSGS
ncbi:hypothetical protein [Phytoactinopolyspora halotolerans]|uniref:Sodium:proton antiporter n=1 Tax=Phytoactinopolyspora halotolerans TaxID=1981512 RepID=A0A6L9S5W6_9ACTN|nr:hypothetical protein [Phytoactinopolyspora halotolerans]NEE00131.1 hypothetical protein [Phytoactinopolyspora halotolerans]